MSALAAGRGISLPSLAAATAAFSARSTGACARIREQFGVPIGDLEGVQDRLGRLAATAYEIDAARRLTCAALDQGLKPAVISAIVKAHATERMRKAVDDAMDLHAGKAIMDGPRNYLGNTHRATPIAITVEGAKGPTYRAGKSELAAVIQDTIEQRGGDPSKISERPISGDEGALSGAFVGTEPAKKSMTEISSFNLSISAEVRHGGIAAHDRGFAAATAKMAQP